MPTKPAIIAALLSLSLSSVDVHASGHQASSSRDSAETSATVIRTTMFARNLEPMYALYRDILGYEVIHQAPYDGSTFRDLFNVSANAEVEFAIMRQPGDDNGNTIGILVVGEAFEESISTTPYRPAYGQVILFAVTNDLDKIYDKVLHADASVVTIVKSPFDTQGGREMVIADANGVRIYVFEEE